MGAEEEREQEPENEEVTRAEEGLKVVQEVTKEGKLAEPMEEMKMEDREGQAREMARDLSEEEKRRWEMATEGGRLRAAEKGAALVKVKAQEKKHQAEKREKGLLAREVKWRVEGLPAEA